MLNNSYKILIVVLILGLAYQLNAQDKGDKFRDKIEKIKIDKLLEKLELDDNMVQTFTDKYKDFSKLIKELNKKRFKAYKLMVENIESGYGLDTLVDQVLGYEIQINDEREKFAEDLKIILSPKQIATMIVFERKFNNEIKKLLKDYKKENNKNK